MHKDQAEESLDQGSGDNEDLEVDIGYLPSIYCTVDINDKLVYRTRTKSITIAPIFESNMEVFIRDWRNMVVAIAARNVRKKEKDTLIGYVVLKAADLFKNSSADVKWFPLVGGVGSGRLKVSYLFRSVELNLREELLGWDIGRFELLEISSAFQAQKTTVRTDGKEQSINSFDLPKTAISLPVFHRYLSPVSFHFSGQAESKPSVHAILWLSNVVENKETTLSLQLWKSKNVSRLLQNKVNINDLSSDVEVVGEVVIKFRLKPGFSRDFEPLLENEDEEDAFEVYNANTSK